MHCRQLVEKMILNKKKGKSNKQNRKLCSFDVECRGFLFFMYTLCV